MVDPADRRRDSDEPPSEAFGSARDEIASGQEPSIIIYAHDVISSLGIEDKLKVVRHLLQGVASVVINDNNTKEFIIHILSPEHKALVSRLLTEFVRAHETKKAKNQRDLGKAINTADRVRKQEKIDIDDTTQKLLVKARSKEKLTAKHHECQEAIRGHDLTFVQGPAGTGKTSLSLEVGLDLLEKGLVSSIVLTKPIVIDRSEERVTGAFRGANTDPYFQNMFDLIEERIGKDRCARLRKDGVIKTFNFNTMHGMNFTGAFVLLDEAQNCNPRQVKKVITRLAEAGEGQTKPKVVVVGDIDQKDSSEGVENGLLHALVHYTARRVRNSAQIFFGLEDVLRPQIVADVQEASKSPDPTHPLYARWCEETGVKADIPLPADAVRSANGSGRARRAASRQRHRTPGDED